MLDFHHYPSQKEDEDGELNASEWKSGRWEAENTVEREEGEVTENVTHKDEVRRQEVDQVPFCGEKKYHS